MKRHLLPEVRARIADGAFIGQAILDVFRTEAFHPAWQVSSICRAVCGVLVVTYERSASIEDRLRLWDFAAGYIATGRASEISNAIQIVEDQIFSVDKGGTKLVRLTNKAVAICERTRSDWQAFQAVAA